jgi:hypothetical protein
MAGDLFCGRFPNPPDSVWITSSTLSWARLADAMTAATFRYRTKARSIPTGSRAIKSISLTIATKSEKAIAPPDEINAA